MHYKITGLSAEPFLKYYGKPDVELASSGVKRMVVNAEHAFPDRIEMRDAEPGEVVLLLNFEHQPADSPYRSSHAIFVREGATETYEVVDTIPDVIARRLQSLRAFDDAGMIIDAEVVEGTEMEPAIERMFADPNVSYIHTHNAKRGCYSGRIDRFNP